MSGTVKSLEIQSSGIRTTDELQKKTMSTGLVYGSIRVMATKIPNEDIGKMVTETRMWRKITQGRSRLQKALTITGGKLITKVAAKI